MKPEQGRGNDPSNNAARTGATYLQAPMYSKIKSGTAVSALPRARGWLTHTTPLPTQYTDSTTTYINS